MIFLPRPTAYWTLVSVALVASLGRALPQESPLPPFGRDTVLVWKTENQGLVDTFVVRIAEFLPNRYVEWENSVTQGTIFMPSGAVAGAKAFVNARLFEGGVDTRGKDTTTLWLSRRAYGELKAKQRVKLRVDSIDGWMTLEGTEQMAVEVNKSTATMPVIKVKDDRGSERWFLDMEENPLMMKHLFRRFTQTLISITTDRANTLRWIKGKKLTDPH